MRIEKAIWSKYPEETYFINSLRLTKVELRKLEEYERKFLLERAKELHLKNLNRCIESILRKEKK